MGTQFILEKRKRKLEDIQFSRGTIVLCWCEHGNGDVQLSHLYRQIGLSTNADVPLADFMAALSPLSAVGRYGRLGIVDI